MGQPKNQFQQSVNRWWS